MNNKLSWQFIIDSTNQSSLVKHTYSSSLGENKQHNGEKNFIFFLRCLETKEKANCVLGMNSLGGGWFFSADIAHKKPHAHLLTHAKHSFFS